MSTAVQERSLARADWLDGLAQQTAGEGDEAQAAELAAAASQIRAAVACQTAGCNGELHFDGKEPGTGADRETGPCPRWGDAGHIATALALLACLFGGLLLLALVSVGQDAMCALHDDGLRYCADYTATTGDTR